MKKRAIYLILLMLILIALAVLFRAHNQYLLLQGEVDAPEVIVASKAKGRVIERHIERGDDVKAGQLMITLDSPELNAQVAALEAAKAQAQAQLDLSIHGTREESIRNLQAILSQAQAQATNATKDYQRLSAVANKGIELLEKYRAALQQAEQQLIELKVQQQDLQVKAPVDGEVGPIPAEVGELFNANSPLATLIRLPEAYFVYNLREDILADIRKGDRITITVPALGNKEVEAEVRYIAPMGDYATKRATRATGDFDLKTFEVRLYPTAQIEGLRPGMSALWRWDK